MRLSGGEFTLCCPAKGGIGGEGLIENGSELLLLG
jgi:hypothetical protein